MPKRGCTLPDNWRVEWECGWGTGHGDEQFGYALYRWEQFTIGREQFTIGRLWWRKRRQGWIFKMWLPETHYNHYGAVEVAAKTERRLQAQDA